MAVLKNVEKRATSAIDNYICAIVISGNESKVLFRILKIVCGYYKYISTETSYENQTKKAITNKFIQESLTEFIRHNFEVYLTENSTYANKIVDQILLNKRSR